MKTVTKEEYLASLRRRSSGFSRGVSKYRGVARHHHNGRWEARIGRVFGNKYLYLGTYSTQEEAARAYDIAAIEYRGINAITNFDLSTYMRWFKPVADTLVSVQEPPTNSESLVDPYCNFNSGEESQNFLFQTNVYGLNSPQNRESHELPISSCSKSSSPTALSLLLRSSIFREMVKKNKTVSDDDNDREDIKNQVNMGIDGEFTRIRFDGNGDFPFVLSSKNQGIELQKELQFTYSYQGNLLGTIL
uniref:Transcription factor AP21 n=1 Tax=Nothapodytes nimmoniana TaxID=159386 RepID=A0A9E8Z7V6_NOTNI|nr:transcription factor AP21 [Nothapodytes nimmoniana]